MIYGIGILCIYVGLFGCTTAVGIICVIFGILSNIKFCLGKTANARLFTWPISHFAENLPG